MLCIKHSHFVICIFVCDILCGCESQMIIIIPFCLSSPNSLTGKTKQNAKPDFIQAYPMIMV